MMEDMIIVYIFFEYDEWLNITRYNNLINTKSALYPHPTSVTHQTQLFPKIHQPSNSIESPLIRICGG
jgi:hypothetical protein